MGEGRTGRCLASDEGVDIHEVVLLGLVEDAIYQVHADGWSYTQIEDAHGGGKAQLRGQTLGLIWRFHG